MPIHCLAMLWHCDTAAAKRVISQLTANGNEAASSPASPRRRRCSLGVVLGVAQCGLDDRVAGRDARAARNKRHVTGVLGHLQGGRGVCVLAI